MVAADPGFFKGRVVAQTDEGAIRNWVNRALPAFGTIGQRPWIFVVGRYRAVTTLSPLATWGSTVSGNDGLYINAPALAIVAQFNGNTGFSFPGPNPIDTKAHRFKTFLDGTNANLIVDYAAYTTPSAAALSYNWTAMAMGTLASTAGIGYEASASLAYVLICSSKPSAAEEAALDAWAASYWGVPDSPPLPAAIHSWWSGSHGMTPANAFDQQPTGITLPGASILAADLPIVGVDASAFNGQPVGQGNRNAYWQQASLVTLMNTNDRPWLYVVCRMTGLLPGQQRVCGLGNNFIGLGELSVSAGSPGRWQMDSFNGSWNVTGPVADALAHRIKSWTAGTVANLSVDDVLSTATIPNAGIQTGVTSIAMFAGAIPNNPAAANIALFMICKSKPTAAEEAALDAWVKAFYGLP
ncbi:MAG TPA: hypothetical protein VNG33_07235 [Polyangiaceae bacterium]|nr:hypothetical protein [Polyangiaceae bacterium]